MTEFCFDTANGELLIGDAAIMQRREELDWAVVSLGSLLLDKTFDELRFTNGHFVEHDLTSREDYQAYGAWVLRVINQEDPRASLTYRHFRRLQQLSVGPSYDGSFSRHFGGFNDFKRTLGAPIGRTRNRYTDWSTADFVAYGNRMAAHIGGKPTIHDHNQAFRKGEGPSEMLIRSRFGTVSAYHEYLGYPDIRSWDKDDFVEWGVRALRANPTTGLTSTVLDTLSSRQRGPSTKSVTNHFGTLSAFQRLIEAGLKQQIDSARQARQSKLEQYRRMLTEGAIAPLDDDSEERLIQAGASRLVIGACAPDIKDDSKARLAAISPGQLISKLMRQVPGLTAGAIEATAVSLEVFDDLWPMDIADYERLHVDLPRKKTSTYLISQGRHRRRPHKQARPMSAGRD